MTRNSSIQNRAASGVAALRIVPAVLAAVLLTLSGCGQRGSAKAEAAESATADTVAQVQSVPTDSSAQKPELGRVVSGTTSSEPAESPAPQAKPAQKATGIAVMDRAAAAGKHLLILFYRNDDDSTQAMRKAFASAVAKLANKANSVTVNVTDAAEQEIVAKFGVDRAPMPLALVVAPTGAVTGGFPGKVTEQQLSGAFVGPGTATCLKALQDNKLVLLCVQNASTKLNDAALKGAREFKSDGRYEKVTEIVTVDPSDATESKFLGQLKIDPKTSQAVTALIAPPGSVVAKYAGATDKNTLVAALTAATSGSGGG
jgi:hypothetical protein